MLKEGAFIAIALVAAGQMARPVRTNPPVDRAKTLEASTHAPANVRAHLDRACRDCHSNDTAWPWYTSVSPLSWLVVRHVEEGRREMSFSTWGDLGLRTQSKRLVDICREVRQKNMPMTSYLLLHPGARLTDAERQAICDWTKVERARIDQVASR